MPALVPTAFEGRVTWIGRVTDRDAALPSDALDEAFLSFAGIAGEAHGGLTRPSCSRVLSQHPRGTEIRNVRQLSIVSVEELAEIARTMGVESLHPRLLGASLAIEGIPDFTRIPPSSRLQGPGGVTLVIDMENQPCHLPARPIDEEGPGNGRAFKKAAQGRRGATAWIEREGHLKLGDPLRLHIPSQPSWRHATGTLL